MNDLTVNQNTVNWDNVYNYLNEHPEYDEYALPYMICYTLKWHSVMPQYMRAMINGGCPKTALARFKTSYHTIKYIRPFLKHFYTDTPASASLKCTNGDWFNAPITTYRTLDGNLAVTTDSDCVRNWVLETCYFSGSMQIGDVIK